MLENLINSHKEDIMKVLAEKFNLSIEQQSHTTEIISSVVTGVITKSATNELNAETIKDLFNSGTSNTANPLFSKMSDLLRKTFAEKTNLEEGQINSISSTGLDTVLSVINKNPEITGLVVRIIGGKAATAISIISLVKKLFGAISAKK